MVTWAGCILSSVPSVHPSSVVFLLYCLLSALLFCVSRLIMSELSRTRKVCLLLSFVALLPALYAHIH